MSVRDAPPAPRLRLLRATIDAARGGEPTEATDGVALWPVEAGSYTIFEFHAVTDGRTGQRLQMDGTSCLALNDDGTWSLQLTRVDAEPLCLDEHEAASPFALWQRIRTWLFPGESHDQRRAVG